MVDMIPQSHIIFVDADFVKWGQEQSSILFLQRINIQSKNFNSRTSAEFGFPNPFQPDDFVSEDADMMVRMWKEGRLAEMFEQTDAEQGDKEDGEILVQNQPNIILDVNFEGCEDSKKDIKIGSYQIRKKKEKIEKLFCEVM